MPKPLTDLIRRTLYLLSTHQGYIANHSLVSDDSSIYTHDREKALAFIDQDSAAVRALDIQDIEPTVDVVAVDLVCPKSQYPYLWMEPWK